VANELRLRVPGEARGLADVRRAIREWALREGVDEPEDVVLAVNEAVGNAIEHSHERFTVAGFIDVVARKEGESIRIDVSDEGSWRPRRADDTRGRGLKIMAALMDEVQVLTSTSGTCVIMRRRVGR